MLKAILVIALVFGVNQESAARQRLGGSFGPPVVWLTPQDNQPRPMWSGSTDFMSLFPPGSPWTTAQTRVKAFKIYPQFVLGASDADLTALIVGLQLRHIPLALEFGLLTDPTKCTVVEGYCGEQTGAAVTRVQSLGGTLAFVGMDEPLWFGHVQVGTSISAMATDVSHQVATIHATFPNCLVGDIEPLPGNAAPSDWPAQIATWHEAFRSAVGIPPAFFHAEVIWPDPNSRAQMITVAATARAAGIRFGILYDGQNSDPTGLAWTLSAEKFFSYIEQNFIPDDAVLQTFDPQPALSLPETTAGTMTSLVLRYMATESVLTATRNISNFTGTLTALGSPVAGATITATRLDNFTVYDTEVTDAAGAFTASSVGVPVQFDFVGDATHRLSFAIVQ